MALWTFIFLFLLFESLRGNEEITSIVPFIFLIAITLVPMILTIRNLKICGIATKLSSIFDTDADGIVSVQYASRVLRISQNKLLWAFDKGVAKEFLQNCSIGEKNGEAIFILKNGLGGGADKQVKTVKCSNCGAFSEVRIGFSNTCSFCGAPLDASQKRYEILLKHRGKKSVLVINIVREVTGLGLGGAFELVTNAPSTIIRNIPYERAAEIEQRLREVGAKAEIIEVKI